MKVITGEETKYEKAINVQLTLKELVTIFSVFGNETTRSAREKVQRKGFKDETFNFESDSNDMPYNIYKDVKRILANEGIEVY